MSKPPALRVAFCGSPDFAVPSLERLCALDALVDVVAVVTQPDRTSGRNRSLSATPVKEAAIRLGVPHLFQWKKLRDGQALADLQALNLDLVVVAAYGRILPVALLEVARLGCVNLHASLLPAWRGASPINHAIWHGDATTGISLMAMDEGLDTGAVYATASLAISEDDTAATLTKRLSALSADLLADCLPSLAAGTLPAKAQPDAGVSHAGLLHKDDGLLRFGADADADELARKVRAFSPWPGTYLYVGQQRVAVLAATALPAASPAVAAGTVVAAGRPGLDVACGSGVLRIERVKPAGGKEMLAGDWIAGRGPKKGATL